MKIWIIIYFLCFSSNLLGQTWQNGKDMPIHMTKIFDVNNYYKPVSPSHTDRSGDKNEYRNENKGESEYDKRKRILEELDKQWKLKKIVDAKEEEKIKAFKRVKDSIDLIQYAKEKQVAADAYTRELAIQHEKEKAVKDSIIKDLMAHRPNQQYQQWEGCYYVGDIKNGKANGVGIIITDGLNTTMYQGEMKDGKMDGSGVYFNVYSKTMYAGNWKNGVKDGPGIEFRSDSTSEEQVWENDLIKQGCSLGNCYNGHGIYNYLNGNWWYGDFENGKITGVGKMRYQNDTKYSGMMVNARRNGKGKLTFGGKTLSGQWKDDQFITGCVSGDCENGEGTFVFNRGIVWQGNFRNGRPHGQGKLSGSDENETKSGKIEIDRNGNGSFKSNTGHMKIRFMLTELDYYPVDCKSLWPDIKPSSEEIGGTRMK